MECKLRQEGALSKDVPTGNTQLTEISVCNAMYVRCVCKKCTKRCVSKKFTYISCTPMWMCL
jgi:hypothetical protein